jgi:hypothetical protein
MNTRHPLRCSCGKVRGHIQLPATTGRAVCYCKDCQAFAHFLQRAGDVLDEAGGTDIVATMPAQVHIEQGLDAVQCMSLSEHGLLRWYASCCKTPIGNTPRDRKTPYIGLIHNCLSAQPLEPSFGPLKVRINTRSAHRPVKSTPLASFLVMMKLMSTMIPARWRGAYRDNPFFDAASGAPIRQPQVLSAAQRAQLRPMSAD